jgi:hypothetical protein
MASNAEFEQYCLDVDERYAEWLHKPSICREDWLMHRNTRGYDATFSRLANRCMAPGCQYPIKDADNYYVMGTGSVCDVCWAMYMAVKMRLFFIDAQREADEIKKRKKG